MKKYFIPYNFNKLPLFVFWANKNGKINIIPTKVLELLEVFGFSKLHFGLNDYQWINVTENKAYEICEGDIIDFLRDYLVHFEGYDVVNELFKSSNKITKYFKQFIKTQEIQFNRDTKDECFIYFRNGYLSIKNDGYTLEDYNKLKQPVWAHKIKDYDFDTNVGSDGDFKTFCYHLANQDDERMRALMSQIGYMVSDYKNPSITKAWILTDKNSDFSGAANGGSGKSLLSEALGHVKCVTFMDGKSIKKRLKNWYIWEPVTRNTSIICLDDLEEGVSLNNFYSIITSGIDIQGRKSGQFRLEFEDSPKIMITSNHPVAGDIGNSDARRRLEFEVSEYYGPYHSPSDEFGRLFFNDWTDEDWISFYTFMAECVQLFLKEGLIEVDAYNLGFKKVARQVGPEFVHFADTHFINGFKMEKKLVLTMLKSQYQTYANLTSHRMTKMINIWAKYKGVNVEHVRSNSKDYVLVGQALVSEKKIEKAANLAAVK